MPKSHFVVILGSSGEAERFPMKAWLRQNPDQLPEGMDASLDTSYQLRRGLKKSGWELEELDNRVLLIRPESGDTSYADTLLTGDDDSEGVNSADVEEAAEITFGLERDLQLTIRSNIEQLERGLSIIDGGKETTTQAGRIDIKASDGTGAEVVIELKAGTAVPRSVAQVLAYMGATAEVTPNDVRGILVAADFHPRVILASRAVPNLTLIKYGFLFSFEKVD